MMSRSLDLRTSTKVAFVMGIRLIVEPRKTVQWKQFSRYPSYSIAVDGYCSGRPRATADGRVLNINHHEDCDRIATRSSCAQALHRVKMGLWDTFSYGGRHRADVYVNDCDQDVTLATYVLMHPKSVDRQRLKLLIQLEDILDMSSGFYPIKKRWHLLKMLNWINEPFTDVRCTPEFRAMDASTMRALIDTTHRRIRETLYGRGKEITPDTRYEVLGKYRDWSLVKEIGSHALIGMAQAGIKAYVSVRAEKDGRFWYGIGRRSSQIISFPLQKIFLRLNEVEGIPQKADDRWGGGDNSGGPPRKAGSVLSPEALVPHVNAVCDEYRRFLETSFVPRR